MKSVEEKVLLLIAEEKLISRNDKIAVGLSGGADSVFLLFFLNKFKKKFNLSLVAVHLNHKLRGKEADADEAFCRELCAGMNIPLICKKKNVKAFAQKKKLSLEEAGREIRYKLFAEAAQKEKCTKIATAHHQSDNTETVLLNLVKGCGLQGASGIPVKRGNIIRPLLAITKDEILNYLQSKKIPFQTDSSNDENNFQRNYLRNEIVRNLKEKINPKIDEKIFNFSSSIKEVLNFIGESVKERVQLVQVEKTGGCKIPLSLLEESHPFLQKAIIMAAIGSVPGLEVTAHSVQGIRKLLTKKVGASFQLPGGFSAVRSRVFIGIGRKQDKIHDEIFIEKNQTKSLLGTSITIQKSLKKDLSFSSDTKVEYLSAEQLKFPLLIRKWENADFFYPFGQSKPKKISKYLTDLKLTPEEKENQLLLLNQSEIIWVIKRRLDNRYAITKSTKKIIKVRCTQ